MMHITKMGNTQKDRRKALECRSTIARVKKNTREATTPAKIGEMNQEALRGFVGKADDRMRRVRGNWGGGTIGQQAGGPSANGRGGGGNGNRRVRSRASTPCVALKFLDSPRSRISLGRRGSYLFPHTCVATESKTKRISALFSCALMSVEEYMSAAPLQTAKLVR